MTLGLPPAVVQEGKATFTVGSAFYRPQSAIARDLAVLAAAIYRQHYGRLRVLDAMTGCGVRPLRYGLEAGADWVWANEGNPELAGVLEQNLATLPADACRITYQDANQVFFTCYQQRDFYDLVDIDNFGSPAPYVSTGLWATRLGGLLYLTSTDGRATSGHDPERCLRTYGACGRSHPAAHEQGLRLIIGHAAQTAAARGMGIEPVFSLFTGQVHRVMVRLVSKPTLAGENYGFVAYCHHCGHFQTADWRHLGRVNCLCGAQDTPVVSGPMWLGPLHDGAMLAEMQGLADRWNWRSQAKLLTIMTQEIDLPPYYYPLGEIGRRGQMDIPNRDHLIAALRTKGYQAAIPSMDWQGVKTSAAFRDCVAIAKAIQP
ncbi:MULTISPECIES: tRNA (guanine-N1)-methyltransferase [Cyanophyceae]|uniref:tRNA (Guanine-N1)-methyltransferase n=1 Tax=Leptolyngbya subtilissima DQ-A4 TaxID=2933933 RepID=A0ABV0JZ38_9CYAN|nr:tRNA (guanine-N1)-methyltransferase [Nodosilinea sp. FACHB-141]MBD2112415.1 tRNA (guanine-N1)-methyltransferase [Nodosilinea sp. FACHB-141]